MVEHLLPSGKPRRSAMQIDGGPLAGGNTCANLPVQADDPCRLRTGPLGAIIPA